jgi:taurine--2-oxoglutarate transaminase
MKRDEIVELTREHVFFSWTAQSKVNPIPVARAEGVYFWDVDGTRYLDFSSQLMNVNAGHGNPKIIKAIQDQVAQLQFVYPGTATEPKARLGQLLAEVTPGDLSKVLFTLGGA